MSTLLVLKNCGSARWMPSGSTHPEMSMSVVGMVPVTLGVTKHSRVAQNSLHRDLNWTSTLSLARLFTLLIPEMGTLARFLSKPRVLAMASVMKFAWEPLSKRARHW
uniref:(northern house mosquito) hypothetical protein n=1 Tax=Culex pipiens TaxID=7175 RepID=A0A8D8BUI0_CULPI